MVYQVHQCTSQCDQYQQWYFALTYLLTTRYGILLPTRQHNCKTNSESGTAVPIVVRVGDNMMMLTQTTM